MSSVKCEYEFLLSSKLQWRTRVFAADAAFKCKTRPGSEELCGTILAQYIREQSAEERQNAQSP